MVLLDLFPDKIKTLADNFGFSSWDWAAVLISLFSLIFGMASLLVAIRTLKSQRRTEGNTTPILNFHIQLFLVNKKLKEAYESYVNLLVLQIALEAINVRGENYRVKPTSQFWDIIKLDEKELHEHLFYDDFTKYYHFHTLVNFIHLYNEDIELLKSVVNDANISKSIKASTLKKAIENLFPIIQLWKNCVYKCFNLSNIEITSILNENIVNCSDLSIERIFKIRNIPTGSNMTVIKSYMDEHPGNGYIIRYLDAFMHLFKEYIGNHNIPLDIEPFKENTLRWIDVIMMNTLYNSNGSLITHIYKGNVGNGSTHVIFNLSQNQGHSSTDNWLNNSYIPEKAIESTSTWLYQILDVD